MTAIAKWLTWGVAAVLAVVSLWQLEGERATVTERILATDAGPVSLYLGDPEQMGPLVVVTHGFAGSRQMMQYISRDLARAGFTVAAFDFYGHGRNDDPLSRDVARIEGTTMQLVRQTKAVVRALADTLEVAGPQAMIGHSMATDIIIRAAKDMPTADTIVAISMYSEAITPQFPKNLLVISGEWEGRLRAAGLAALAQIDASATEGETVRLGDVARRSVYTPNTEHVAVLFATETLEETRDWLQTSLANSIPVETKPRGLYVLILLAALVILSAPVARLLPKSNAPRKPISGKTAVLALLLPIVPASLAAVYLGGSLLGAAGFASLFWFFSLWGLIACAVLIRAGHSFYAPDPRGVALLLIWTLGVFAVALDRYGAAFLPTGSRFPLMLVLLAATVPFMLADRVLLHEAPIWQRLVARALPVAALCTAMVLFPDPLGLLFTVLPVLVLFYTVYGTMGHFVARRMGPETAAIGLAVVLAWSIAASTPLFVG